jgi:hypothetical protein
MEKIISFFNFTKFFQSKKITLSCVEINLEEKSLTSAGESQLCMMTSSAGESQLCMMTSSAGESQLCLMTSSAGESQLCLMTSSAGESQDPEIPDLEDLHKIACEKEEEMFLDPKTGYYMMTAFYLKKRGKCCGSGCKFCPYTKERVKKERVKKDI